MSHTAHKKNPKSRLFLPDFTPSLTPQQEQWRPLHLLNLYRLLIAGIFVSLIFASPQVGSFGETNTQLFLIASIAYLVAAILNGMTIRWRWPAIGMQIHAHIIIDFAALLVIMHASGGVKSGVGLLLLIPVAAISILSMGRASIFYAAIVALLILLGQAYLQLTLDTSPNYTQTGLLGAMLFVTAMVTNYLVHKTEESVEIATQREVDLANMEQLTEFIMQRMQTAVVVVDHLGYVKLINDTAIKLLKLSKKQVKQHTNLYEYSLALGELFQNWKIRPKFHGKKIILEKDASELSVKFAALGHKDQGGAVLFLEDNAELTQAAQQLKLASLGRLTASIAHELRNPLAAIRHAGELLNESPSLEKTDQRLTEIIEKQSIRVNEIITTVLELSRRHKAELEVINLNQWMQGFLNEDIQLAQERFYLKFEAENLEVLFDAQHLQQIVNNLVQNALRHTTQRNKRFRPIIISAGIDIMKQRRFLQVMNYGPRIPKEDLGKLFEPFFTTEASGTGLGLYIARELAIANSAKLEYIDIKEGACFQLSFADPRRKT